MQLDVSAKSADGFYGNCPVLRLCRLVLDHKEMLLYSPLLFFSAFLWSVCSSLALTFEDMMALKSSSLGIY